MNLNRKNKNNNTQFFTISKLRKQFLFTMYFVICILSAISTTTTTAEIAMTENTSSFISTMLLLSQNKHQVLHSEKPIHFEITNDLKNLIRTLVDNGTNAAMVIGLVDSNGTHFYGYGKTSNATNAPVVNENTIFDIGSITKTFTTTLLADIVNEGILRLEESN